MTYKHNDFQSSPVMRSLERVAKEKGWLEAKPITKSASNEVNLEPSSNLTENILKLCAGLRKSGFDKYALDIENKFISFKQAATLYEVSGEKGEDLIDAAHPKGSHKMEDLDNAVFKTILDKHLDMIKLVDSKPSGKLSNASEILTAVKVVLSFSGAPSAQPETDLEDNISEDQLVPLRNKAAIANIYSAINILDKCRTDVFNKMNTATLKGSFDTNYKEILTEAKTITEDSPPAFAIKQINSILGDLGDIHNSINFFNWKDLSTAVSPFSITSIPNILRHVGDISDLLTGDWAPELRDKLTALVNQAETLVKNAKNYVMGSFDENIKQQLKSKPKQVKKPDENPVITQINIVKKRLDGLKSLITSEIDADPSDKNEALAWLDKRYKALQSIDINLTPEQVSASLSKILKGVDYVEKQWA